MVARNKKESVIGGLCFLRLRDPLWVGTVGRVTAKVGMSTKTGLLRGHTVSQRFPEPQRFVSVAWGHCTCPRMK